MNGGTLVVTFTGSLTSDQMQVIRETIKDAIPDIHVVIVANASSAVYVPAPDADHVQATDTVRPAYGENAALPWE